KRRSTGPASWRANSAWCPASTVTPRYSARRRSGQVLDPLAIEIDTSGGSMLTEVNELAARPTGTPSMSATRATTPEGKAPKTSRNAVAERSWLVANVVMWVLQGRGQRRMGAPGRATHRCADEGCAGRR